LIASGDSHQAEVHLHLLDLGEILRVHRQVEPGLQLHPAAEVDLVADDELAVRLVVAASGGCTIVSSSLA
jgi:hypothetical protein